ncbi:MAG: hypothetical protein ONB44_25045 [candidate division KSB1 bacterium]|nr:hypothetical protein [candidate division KSB1 bacterium]
MDNFKIIDGKKFMWDGVTYDSEAAAMENVTKYSADGFETRLLKEDDKYLVYTRRVAKVVKAEGQPT